MKLRTKLVKYRNNQTYNAAAFSSISVDDVGYVMLWIFQNGLTVNNFYQIKVPTAVDVSE